MNHEAILTVENLNIAFDGNKIIEDLNFEVKKGDIMAVIGPNGAGKTVLFRALLGLVPYTGKISWQEGVRVGYVPQRFVVERHMPLSVNEFLEYKKGGKNKIKEVLNWVGLDGRDEHHLVHHLLKRPLGVLSGGELQKVLIAFALLGSPKVLLFDEPTTGIDIGGEETIYNLLKKIKSEHDLTIIFISHDIHVVYKYANNVLCINREKICLGPPHEALSSDELKKLYGTDVGIYPHTHKHL
jgi:zinc transport system ATP-binding protein